MLKLPDNRPIFYTSDPHFHHGPPYSRGSIIKYCNRPFTNAVEMDATLIERWNAKVPKNGLVMLLGDVLWGGASTASEILPKLNGEKVLIIGNHDREHCLKPYVSSVHEILIVKDPAIQSHLVLCHYPFEEWPGMYHGSAHLHGHRHGQLGETGRLMKNRMDVGVDLHPNFEPFSSEEVLRYLKGS